MPPKAAPAKALPVDFEQALTQLEALVNAMEKGQLSLDESLKAFEQGIQLSRQCQQALKQAEQKVELLLNNNGHTQPFDAAP